MPNKINYPIKITFLHFTVSPFLIMFIAAGDICLSVQQWGENPFLGLVGRF